MQVATLLTAGTTVTSKQQPTHCSVCDACDGVANSGRWQPQTWMTMTMTKTTVWQADVAKCLWCGGACGANKHNDYEGNSQDKNQEDNCEGKDHNPPLQLWHGYDDANDCAGANWQTQKHHDGSEHNRNNKWTNNNKGCIQENTDNDERTLTMPVARTAESKMSMSRHGKYMWHRNNNETESVDVSDDRDDAMVSAEINDVQQQLLWQL